MVSESIVLVTVLIMFAMVAVLFLYAAGYRKVAPNKAMVLFRGKRSEGDEPRGIISGGGKFIIPGAGTVHILDLTAEMMEFEMDGLQTTYRGSPTKMRLRVATIWKISSSPDSLKANASKLVDRTRGENKMAVREALERSLQALAASVSMEEFESDRDLVAGKVSYAARDLLNELGLEIRSLVLLSVRQRG